jgi:hypothetical protein
MMPRQRDSIQVRDDALKMAVQKAKAGCRSCAQSYFELAQKHGASAEEIRRAIDQVGGMNRRDLLKLAASVVAGVALGTNEALPQRAEALSSCWWGTDSASTTCCGIPQDFYIGRFGYGTTGSTYFFNIRAAQAAGKSSTYIFWGLEGPGIAPQGMTPYSWGWLQAQAAIAQQSNNLNAALVGGSTIFADIESGFGGWNAGYYRLNQHVVQGFLNGIANASIPPGIYIAPGDWRNYFGTAFRPGQAFVLWISWCYSCSSRVCIPCSRCATTLTDVENLLPKVMSTTLGGSQAVLWQYWLDPPCGCGDFNVATQSPTLGFKPVKSSTTYYSVC